MAHPDTYKGRYVLLRAQVADVRTEGDKPTVWLVEHALGSMAIDREVGPTSRTEVSTRTTSGPASGPARAGEGGYSSSSSEQWVRGKTVRQYDNVSNETGREALGRLPKPDPFFEPGKDFVVLARFDGVRIASGGSEDDEEAPRLPVLTIVSYHPPHPLVVY
jgi:hypothetical protein